MKTEATYHADGNVDDRNLSLIKTGVVAILTGELVVAEVQRLQLSQLAQLWWDGTCMQDESQARNEEEP